MVLKFLSIRTLSLPQSMLLDGAALNRPLNLSTAALLPDAGNSPHYVGLSV